MGNSRGTSIILEINKAWKQKRQEKFLREETEIGDVEESDHDVGSC